MTCHRIAFPDGTVGIMCIRGRARKRCSAPGCDRVVERECDFPVFAKGRKSRTCDAGVCLAHARSVGPDLDYCPPHARYLDEHGGAPGQRGLFDRE